MSSTSLISVSKCEVASKDLDTNALSLRPWNIASKVRSGRDQDLHIRNNKKSTYPKMHFLFKPIVDIVSSTVSASMDKLVKTGSPKLRVQGVPDDV